MTLRLIVLLWACCVGTGFAVWESLDATPGQIGQPTDNDLATPRRSSLVVFLHPHCPCSRATLDELSTISNGSDLQIVFVRPNDTPPGWEQCKAWDRATEIPGAHVRSGDEDEARRNGAATSGHVIARDATGVVVFHGGITPGRGRRGDNAGRQAVETFLRGGTPSIHEWPVYGCPLFSPSHAPACCQDPTAKSMQND